MKKTKFQIVWRNFLKFGIYMLLSKRKCYNKIKFFVGIFLDSLAKKQSKLIKNEENRPNFKPFDRISEIWYVDAFQHKKIQQKNIFLILAFLGLFVGQKTAKIDKKNKKIINSIIILPLLNYLINLDYILKIQRNCINLDS